MPTLFNLDKEEFLSGERLWTYSCLFKFDFKKNIIHKITITDHYQIEHKDQISNELILNILKEKINGRERMRPRNKYGNREIFVRERISYQGKKYRLVFWFKDGTTNHLWIRNFHPQD